MIILKEQGIQEVAFVNNSHPSYNGGYSILLQNTTTKDITIFDVTDKGNKVYNRFNIDINLPQGEYYVILFENPYFLPFKADMNDVKNIDTVKYATIQGSQLKANGKNVVIGNSFIKYLASDDNTLMSGDFYLMSTDDSGNTTEQPINYIQSDMLRIGEYKNPNKTYKKEQGYIQYKN